MPSFPDIDEKRGIALKNDEKDGKIGRRYVHPKTLDACELAHEAGAAKYEPLGFTKGHKQTQLISAAIRHLEKVMWEGDVDEDCTSILGKEVSHLGCALANINMLITQRELGTSIDDRALALRKGNK